MGRDGGGCALKGGREKVGIDRSEAEERRRRLTRFGWQSRVERVETLKGKVSTALRPFVALIGQFSFYTSFGFQV